jgi:glycosyltransferase involved in cell wall biosynthesis
MTAPRHAAAPSILIDVGPAAGDHGERGIGRYVRGLASSIAMFPNDLGDRIWAVGTEGRTLDSFGGRALRLGAHHGLGHAPSWAAGRLVTDVALRKSGARVFHATDPQRPWIRRGVATIVTVYDLIPLRERALLQSWRFDHQLAYRGYIRQVKSATRIVAISHTTAQDVHERLGIPLERIDIVYPMVAVPPRLDRTEPAEPTFLFVGALDAHKQPELALKALALFRARSGFGRLRYIGPSDDARARDLHDLAAHLGIAASTSIEGRVSDEELECAYATATALLSTSRIEGFGLPAVEAAIRGLPVIAVETPAAIETLDDAASIVPAQPEAIAEAMARPTRPGELARTRLRDRYSIAGMARSLADSYRNILNGG